MIIMIMDSSPIINVPVKKIKGAAYNNGDVDGTCKKRLIFIAKRTCYASYFTNRLCSVIFSRSKKVEIKFIISSTSVHFKFPLCLVV